jgi:sterol desaturase/sphingolipid hydroxylase (fatty acid hydroxylase superfamily)
MIERRPLGLRVTGAVVVAVEAVTAVLVSLGLLRSARLHPGQGYAVAGLIVLLAGAGLAVVAAGVASDRRSARRTGIALQALLAVGSLAGLARRPAASLIGLAIEIAAVVLLRRAVARVDDDASSAAPGVPPAPPGAAPLAGRTSVAVLERPAEPAGQQLTAGGLLLGSVTALMVLGALAIRSGLIVGLVLLALVFIPLEKLFTLHPQRVFRRGWRTDLVHFVVNNLLTTALLLVPVVGLGVLARAAVPAAAREAIADQPSVVQALEVLLIAGFAGYWAHRATHTVPVLWRFHKVHHSIQQMDWLAAARLHPIDSVFTRTCAVLPLFALGFTRGALGGFIAFTTLQAIFIHANVRLTFGPLRWLVATPEFHHWHHANEPEAYNTNFAGEFPWMDAVFGTLYLPKGRMPARYGIDDAVPDGYLPQLAWPFRNRTPVAA